MSFAAELAAIKKRRRKATPKRKSAPKRRKATTKRKTTTKRKRSKAELKALRLRNLAKGRATLARKRRAAKRK